MCLRKVEHRVEVVNQRPDDGSNAGNDGAAARLSPGQVAGRRACIHTDDTDSVFGIRAVRI